MMAAHFQQQGHRQLRWQIMFFKEKINNMKGASNFSLQVFFVSNFSFFFSKGYNLSGSICALATACCLLRINTLHYCSLGNEPREMASFSSQWLHNVVKNEDSSVEQLKYILKVLISFCCMQLFSVVEINFPFFTYSMERVGQILKRERERERERERVYFNITLGPLRRLKWNVKVIRWTFSIFRAYNWLIRNKRESYNSKISPN